MLSDNDIKRLYEQNKKIALQSLQTLPIYGGNNINILGLNGWIFEQVIRYCLKQEFSSRGIKIPYLEQVKIKSRAKVDLCLNDHIWIENKVSGIYDKKDLKK